MIELSHDSLIMAFLVTAIGMMAVIFFYILLTTLYRNAQRKKTHLVCRLCGYRYLNEEKQKLTACPHCGGLNKRGGVKRH